VTEIPDAATHSFEGEAPHPPLFVRGEPPDWLADLTAQWGRSLLTRLEDPIIRHGSPAVRSLWVWAPDHVNHLLTVDRYEAPWIKGYRWVISTEANEAPAVQVVTADCRAEDRPDDLIRSLLVAAGWLA
jgi:hypothetical protein